MTNPNGGAPMAVPEGEYIGGYMARFECGNASICVTVTDMEYRVP